MTLPLATPASMPLTAADLPGWGSGGDAVGKFQAALADVQASGAAEPPNQGLRSVLNAFDALNAESDRLRGAAETIQTTADVSPGQTVELTLLCTEFTFHSELVASLAHQTSEGLQQLFREQG